MNKYDINIDNYSKEYFKEHTKDISYESILAKVRRKQVLRSINGYGHRNILEVGCGMEPLFLDLSDYDTYTIAEPSTEFVQNAKKLAEGNEHIHVIQGFLEEIYEKLQGSSFDFILLSGVLHEVLDPFRLLKIVHDICNENTIVHINVPNVYSFHRLLAYEMNYISSIYEKSETEAKFQRHSRFDKQRLFKIVEESEFAVLSYGTYFIKPFSNHQMEKAISYKIVNKNIIEGLERMIKYMPDLGCEMFVDAKVKSNL